MNHDELKHLSANLTLCAAKKHKKKKREELPIESTFYSDFPKYKPDLWTIFQYYWFKIKEKILRYFYSE